MRKGGWVYMMANYRDGTLYIGVTSDLVLRASQHRASDIKGFTQKYGLKRLVYFERHDDIVGAITREKALKKWRRSWKVELIEKANPDWQDLYGSVL